MGGCFEAPKKPAPAQVGTGLDKESGLLLSDGGLFVELGPLGATAALSAPRAAIAAARGSPTHARRHFGGFVLVDETVFVEVAASQQTLHPRGQFGLADFAVLVLIVTMMRSAKLKPPAWLPP